MTTLGAGAVAGVYERGMRVRLRGRLWEIEEVRGAGKGAFLDLRLADERPGPRRVTVLGSAEPTLRPEPAAVLRFDTGNPVHLGELHSALALTMAHGRGDLLAVEHGRIDVEPYQLVPVLAGLRQPRVRLLVADDVGLGKTIEAGLILLELARRGRASRVLIACPAGLQEQWAEEMRFRFNLDFVKVDSRQWLELRRSYPASVSPWTAAPYAVSSIDYLKNNLPAIQAAPPFDLVIIDEAHHVARAYAGDGRSEATDRSRLARALADHARELILLSATPHNGYQESFASLLQLLSPHLAADDGRLDPGMVRPYVVRRLKDDVARGDPPQPISRRYPPQPIVVSPTAREKEIHQRLRGHSRRVLRALRGTDSYYVQAFALEVLRKRALSSPHALLLSLRHRAESLHGAPGAHAARRRRESLQVYRGDVALPEADLIDTEELALSGVAAHLPEDDLREEQRLVGTLLELTQKVTPADDSKLTRLRGWLEGFRAGQRGQRVIVFTEYRDTLDYTRDEEILRRLREKLAEITRQLGSSSDVLGIGGRGEVIDGLLEDLTAEELDARLERAAEQVRDYLATSGALMVLRSNPDEPQDEADTSTSRQRARWLLPDFNEYRALVTSVVRQCQGRIDGTGDVLTIDPGPLLRHYPGVPAGPFPATFSRAAALDPEQRGIAFLTPVHPLVRAVLQRMRSRLYDGRATDRVAVHPVTRDGEGWLFTAIGRLIADDGQLLEEPLIPVFVPRSADGLPGEPSQDPAADTRRLRSRPARGGPEVIEQARRRLAAGFDAAAAAAVKEAARRLQQRAAELRAQLAADAARLATDLDRWHAAELAEAERRLAAGPGGIVQLGLFTDTGQGTFRTLEDARALVDEEFQRRRDTLATGCGVADAAEPEPVGCLLCVETASC